MDGDEAMNSGDIEDVLVLLAEQRAANNHAIMTYQNKLAYRLREQLVRRCWGTDGDASTATGEFVRFAHWLEECGSLEMTYRAEAEGGLKPWRPLQLAAETVRTFGSQQLRRTLYYSNGDAYLEEWHEWFMPALEAQLNRWRHLPGTALPLYIDVKWGMLAVPSAYKALVAPYGSLTLYFHVRPHETQ